MTDFIQKLPLAIKSIHCHVHGSREFWKEHIECLESLSFVANKLMLYYLLILYELLVVIVFVMNKRKIYIYYDTFYVSSLQTSQF